MSNLMLFKGWLFMLATSPLFWMLIATMIATYIVIDKMEKADMAEEA